MQIKCIHLNKYNVIYIIKYSCIDAIIIFHNPGAISSSLSQIDIYIVIIIIIVFIYIAPYIRN